MPNSHCPYLANWGAQGRNVAPIDYPSFENHCAGQDDQSSLLLSDQATYCLSGSHRFCPIYMALAADEPAAPEPPSFALPRRRPFPPPSAVSDQRQQPFIPWEPTPSRPQETADSSPFPKRSHDGSASGVRRQATAHAAAPSSTPSTTPYNEPDVQADLADEFSDEFSEYLPDAEHFSSGNFSTGNSSWSSPFPFTSPLETALSSNRWWAWMGAILLFFAVIGMGSLIAAYAGWQLALEQLATARAGPISTLENTQLPLQSQVQPLYVVMTATSEPLPPADTAPVADPNVAQSPAVIQPRTGQGSKPDPITGVDNATPQDAAQNNFPVAVTPTAIIVVPLPGTGQTETGTLAETPPAQVIPSTATPVPIQLPPANVAPTPAPVIDVQVQVPTRRPTPVFDIPTSTALPETPEPTPTETLVPIWGTPVVVFAPDQSAVAPGKCTKVRWRVENVREVYYESLPMFGMGDREECLKEDPETFALTVVFPDGQTRIFTTTVGITWPTATPSITPSFTPEIEPTETWTPLPPTATPTPDVVYGTTLAVNSENPTRCRAGETCTIDVLATNTGDTIDTLAVELVAGGNWTAQICSQVGTCGSPTLVVANVGPANTVFVTLQITIPADSAGQSSNYALRSVSQGSGGAITSQVAEITVTSE